jgi:hypothetical protein
MKARNSLLVLAVVLMLGLMLAPVSCRALAMHDAVTRRETLDAVARELAKGSSLVEMRAFMERHTTRFALDDRFKHEYVGFAPQTWLDRQLFNRQVQVNLFFDENHRFKAAEVNVFYTFL